MKPMIMALAVFAACVAIAKAQDAQHAYARGYAAAVDSVRALPKVVSASGPDIQTVTFHAGHGAVLFHPSKYWVLVADSSTSQARP